MPITSVQPHHILKIKSPLTEIGLLMGRNLPSALTFVPLGFGRLYLAMQDRNQAQAIALHELNKKHVLLDASIWQQNLSIEDNSTSAVPSLEWLLRFNSSFNAFCRQNAEAPIVIYTGIRPHRQAQTMFLVGCHLLTAVRLAICWISLVLSITICPCMVVSSHCAITGARCQRQEIACG